MLKTFLILVLVLAGYKFYKNIRLVQKTPRKKEQTDYQKMNIQDAEFEDKSE